MFDMWLIMFNFSYNGTYLGTPKVLQLWVITSQMLQMLILINTGAFDELVAAELEASAMMN